MRDPLDKASGASLRKLSSDMRKLEVALRKTASDTARDGVVHSVGMLARNTPVDSSKAASNWTATAGFPATKEIEAHHIGAGGSTQEASVRAAIERARNNVQNKKPGQTLFITNNVPYMERLAAGYSKQAGPGWIEAVLNISEGQWKPIWPIIR